MTAPSHLWRVNASRLKLVLSGVGASIFSTFGCPACWSALAGILSSAGLGFLLRGPSLIGFTVVPLAIALAALGYRARSRHGYGPLSLGVLAAAVIGYGKFVSGSLVEMVAGMGLLIAMSIWNAWPKRDGTPSCPRCTLVQLPALKSESIQGSE